MKQLLLGNEAIALGALRAGVKVITGYPGTPSTEILETAAKRAGPDVHVEWSVNEKTALEVAAGAALAGSRALVTMKQVGLNVASDPLMSLNYLGVAGALVLAVADDPGPLSSQTEQDTRRFGLYAKVAVFDPASVEDAYRMTAEAFEWSARYGRPVIIRPTTRVCHCRAPVELLPPIPTPENAGFDRAGGRWVIFPSRAYRGHLEVEDAQRRMKAEGARRPGSRVITINNDDKSPPRFGVAAGGASWAYLQDALGLLEKPPAARLLKVETYPFPDEEGLAFLEGLDEVLVFEELDAVIEDSLTLLCGRQHRKADIYGRHTGDVPLAGELDALLIAKALSARALDTLPPPTPPKGGEYGITPGGGGDGITPGRGGGPVDIPPRPPMLCAGCPHRGSFLAVKEAVARSGRRAVYFGDIGCYTLGMAPPLGVTDACLCMGAGLGMAQGLPLAEPDTLSVAFIGDSTFFHTGLPGLVNAVHTRADVLLAVLDNRTTAMTGGQSHPGMPCNARGEAAPALSIRALAQAAGVTDIVTLNPFTLKDSVAALLPLLEKRGLRIALFEGPCAAQTKHAAPPRLDAASCKGCLACVRKLGCPALSSIKGDGNTPASVRIDSSLCAGCGLCAEVCPFGAFGLNLSHNLD
ncbi:MAG: 4Fe-4S binding protein [Treponema sp.]|jgi:indolepyruvate ferredoxin oxidoreductase alpha subunit|nr:4Fe-4S binding protein [Treponema sp.]